MLDYMVATTTNTIELADILELAGATIVHDVPDCEFIDLSPAALDSGTIIGLLSK